MQKNSSGNSEQIECNFLFSYQQKDNSAGLF